MSGRTKIFLATVLWAAHGASLADPARVLTDAQWRADWETALEAIRTTHPALATPASTDAVTAARARADALLPSLSDQGAFIELARIVSLLGDGHTRLTFERTDPARISMFESGHRGREFTGPATLRFGSLPLKFAVFADGLFVVAATRAHSALVGAEVLAFDGTAAAAAIVAVRAVSFADNDGRARALAGSRLEMPALLQHLGLVRDASAVGLRLRLPDGELVSISLPLSDDPIQSPDPAITSQPPVCADRKSGKLAWNLDASRRAMVVRVDQLEGMPDVPVSVQLGTALHDASLAKADRFVIDLRCNFGGDSSWNSAYVKALLASPYDVYGRLFVLIGRNTYSAAVRLALDLESLTQAIFVGEAAGSPPTFPGDPKRVRLTHSGIDLRVATIRWQSYLAGDFRTAFPATLVAEPVSTDYFGGRDAALEAALSFVPAPTLAGQMRDLFMRGFPQEALLRFFSVVGAPGLDVSRTASELDALGQELLEAKRTRDAVYVYTVGSEYLDPASGALASGLAKARAAAK